MNCDEANEDEEEDSDSGVFHTNQNLHKNRGSMHRK